MAYATCTMHEINFDGKSSYFAAEIQASLWSAGWEVSAETAQIAMQKLILQQWEAMRLTHVPLKTQNMWTYSRLENKQTIKHIHNKQTKWFIFFYKKLYAKNLGVQNTPKLYG